MYKPVNHFQALCCDRNRAGFDAAKENTRRPNFGNPGGPIMISPEHGTRRDRISIARFAGAVTGLDQGVRAAAPTPHRWRGRDYAGSAAVERRCRAGRKAQESGKVRSTTAATSIIMCGTPTASLASP